MRTLEAELALDARAVLAEGPHWDADSGRLLWVNITPGEIHWFDPETGQDSMVNAGTMVGTAVPREAGGIALAVQDGFALIDDDGHVSSIADVEAEIASNRMNDGKCDSQGRFWAGTMDMNIEQPVAALYRLGVDGKVKKVLSGVALSNGLGWSPDDTLMYYTDSLLGRVDVFDYEPVEGRISNRRTIVRITDDEAIPDGMTVDSEGFIWVSVYGAGVVRRYDPEGVADLEIRLPASNVTSCAFGGPDLGDLYITTAAQFMSEQELREQPHAGGIFRARTGHTGMSPHRFRG